MPKMLGPCPGLLEQELLLGLVVQAAYCKHCAWICGAATCGLAASVFPSLRLSAHCIIPTLVLIGREPSFLTVMLHA